MCVCVHVVSVISQETLLVITRIICSSFMLALASVTLACAIYKYRVCPAPGCIHLSQSSLSVFSSLAGTALFVILVQSICLLLERIVYIS